MSKNPYASRDDRDSRKEMKNMSFKEKREHIWAYYKLHIGIVAAVVVVIGYLLNVWVFNPPKKTWLNVATYNIYLWDEDTQYLTERLTALMPEDMLPKNEVSVRSFVMTSDDPQFTMAQQMSFDAVLVAGEIDVLIVERGTFESEFEGAEIFESAAYADGLLGEGAWVGVVNNARNNEAAYMAQTLLIGK